MLINIILNTVTYFKILIYNISGVTCLSKRIKWASLILFTQCYSKGRPFYFLTYQDAKQILYVL